MGSGHFRTMITTGLGEIYIPCPVQFLCRLKHVVEVYDDDI